MMGRNDQALVYHYCIGITVVLCATPIIKGPETTQMDAWLLLAVTAALSVAALAHEWWTKRRVRRLTANLPGWTDVPLLGNLHRFYGGPTVIFQRFQEITAKSAETGFFKLWLGPHFFVCVHKPEVVKIVTNTYSEKTYLYNFSRPWLGNGLVTAPGHIWKHNIKSLAGTFTGGVVDGYQDTFNQNGRKLLQKMKKEVGQPAFDAQAKYLAYTTLESICQTALGVAAITDSITTEEYYRAFNRTLELMVQRALNPLVHPDFVYRLTPAYYEFKRSVKILHNVSETVLAKRRAEWNAEKKNNNSNHVQTEDKKSKFRPFLDILIELSETDPLMTPEQIRSEVDTIIVGGQETTAGTLFYTLLMLGCHQDVQDKLYNELKEIFGDSNRSVEKEDLARMTYCDAVILETMRLLPSIPAIMRYVDSDLQLDGSTIPAGTGCIVNIWAAGRSPELWGPDALQFRPERWLNGKVPPASHPAAFLPFSYGRRSCIGKKYAMAIIKTLLAHLLRELTVESQAHDMQFKFDIALRPTTGHLMQVRLRG